PNAIRRRARSSRCAACAISNVSKMSLAIFAVCEFPRPWRSSSSNDLALTQKMRLAFSDMALDLGEMIEKHRPLHAHNIISVWPGRREAAGGIGSLNKETTYRPRTLRQTRLACDAAYPKKFHLAVEKLPFSRRGIGALASVIAGVGNKSGDTMTITQYLAAT